jgi:dienelactone hydrolase
MNERGPRYNADADKNSWPRTLDFFARTLQQAPVAADN